MVVKNIILVSTPNGPIGAFSGTGLGYVKASAYAAKRCTRTGLTHSLTDIPWEPEMKDPAEAGSSETPVAGS